MELPVKEKFALSIKEAAAYFHIGEKTLRTFAKEHPEVAVFMNRRYVILREEMEALYRRHFAKKEEERVRPGGKEPFQQTLEDAAWYFQWTKSACGASRKTMQTVGSAITLVQRIGL